MKLLDIIDNTPIPVGYRIAFLTNFWREPLLRRMEREFGLIRPEWTVLICLVYRDGLNSRDICEVTEQPSNSISRGVAALEEKGLIHRRPDPQEDVGGQRLLAGVDRGRGGECGEHAEGGQGQADGQDPAGRRPQEPPARQRLAGPGAGGQGLGGRVRQLNRHLSWPAFPKPCRTTHLLGKQILRTLCDSWGRFARTGASVEYRRVCERRFLLILDACVVTATAG